jgi:hypothetical protein
MAKRNRSRPARAIGGLILPSMAIAVIVGWILALVAPLL